MSGTRKDGGGNYGAMVMTAETGLYDKNTVIFDDLKECAQTGRVVGVTNSTTAVSYKSRRGAVEPSSHYTSDVAFCRLSKNPKSCLQYMQAQPPPAQSLPKLITWIQLIQNSIKSIKKDNFLYFFCHGLLVHAGI